ncbi:MAG: carboxylating nicotinate-nucleotide diphosphorylase [Gammaproteobacteria bacterium]|nr:carboxylating nicotinate-nucleotide diphosphorylase [Gammaproteobacteria bacterium]
MANIQLDTLHEVITADVQRALAEDVGSGDITAALIPAERQATATIITREAAIFCGRAWADEVLRQVDPALQVDWLVADGDSLTPDQLLCTIKGPARSLLTAERCILNFLQTLSATATRSRHYADIVAGTPVRLLDTRKTLPGLRMAQKYAVTCGGCHNHRIGLFDAFLIKENHIAACGGITAAVAQARLMVSGKPVEVEVESLEEMQEALEAGADIIMLDELSHADMRTAVERCQGRAKLEASGGITEATLRSVAETGVDYISIGSITKHIQAVDLSLRLTMAQA